MRLAGQYEEAIEFADSIVQNWPQIEAVGRDAYWFVNEYAYTLSDAAYPEKAHALMKRLVNLGVAENGQLISMAINRAMLLLHWGNFEAALAAIDEIEGLDDDLATEYGWMWIYYGKACSLYQLGRAQEAAAVLRDSIAPIAEKNHGAHTKTLLCLEETDAAAETVIDRLHQQTEKGDVILSFAELTGSKPTPPLLAVLQERAEEMRERPEVRREFNKVGRVISFSGANAPWVTF